MGVNRAIGKAFLAISDIIPDQPAVITDEMTVSYRQLASVARSFSLRMRQLGVTQDSIVAVNSHDLIVVTGSVLATSLIGCGWVAASSSLAKAKVVQPTHFFKSPEVTGSKDVDFIEMDETWGPAVNSVNSKIFDGYLEEIDDVKGWIYARTSGTTGTPKYIAFSQSIMFDRSKVVSDDFVAGKTVFASLFDCTAFPFITRALASLLNSCTIVYSWNFELWERAGVNLVMGSPAQAKNLFQDISVEKKFPLIHIAGSPLDNGQAKELLGIFEEVVDIYASTETNRSYKNVKKLNAGNEVETYGYPVDSIVEIVDAGGNICAPNAVGDVRVSNPYLAKGYLNDDAAGKKAFQGKWFYPGDLGTWGKNNELRILGRTDDVINIGGVKVSARLIDEILRSVEGVKDAICFESPRIKSGVEILAFVSTEDPERNNDILAKAKEACVEKLGVMMSPRRIFNVDEIPRSDDGNPQRKIAQQLALEKIAENIPTQQKEPT